MTVKIKRKRRRRIRRVNHYTILALLEVFSGAEIAKMLGVSSSLVSEIKRGNKTFPLQYLNRPLLAKLGLRVCTCCGIRIVPKKLLGRGIKLTRLCKHCYETIQQDEEYSIGR